MAGDGDKNAKSSELCILDAVQDKKLVTSIKGIKKGEKPIMASIHLILDGIVQQNLDYDTFKI